MNKKLFSFFATVCLLLAGNLAFATSTSASLNPATQKAFEQRVHDYIVNNPEVLIEASEALQKKRRLETQAKAEQAITDNSAALFQSSSPVAGNNKGSVAVVEFFDYQCGHCKRMAPIIDSLLAIDQDVRVIYKEFPIFGKNSEWTAKAALASRKQGKYIEFHNALMKTKAKLDKKKVLQIAKQVGINTKKLQEEILAPQYAEILKANRKLANELGLRGTPAFIIASQPGTEQMKMRFAPGAMSQGKLQNMIKEVR